MVNARTATAIDFDKAAQEHATAFWFLLIATALTWWLFSIWWSAIPAILAIFSAIRSVGATMAASSLRKGTYKIPNPNNGRPDNGARNVESS